LAAIPVSVYLLKPHEKMKLSYTSREKWERFGNGALWFMIATGIIAFLGLQFARQSGMSTEGATKEDAVVMAATPTGQKYTPDKSFVEVRTPTRTLEGTVGGSFYPQETVTAYYRLDKSGEAYLVAVSPRAAK
jgi:hypothetical protein